MKLSHFCPLDRTTWLRELVGQRLCYIYESIFPSLQTSNNIGGTPYTVTSSNALRNRYSLVADVSDSVSAQNGTVLGTANVAGGQVNMPGVAGSYVALPGCLIQGVSPLTLECWASFGVNVNNVLTFEFGNTNGASGSRYLGFIRAARVPSRVRPSSRAACPRWKKPRPSRTILTCAPACISSASSMRRAV